MKKIGFLTVFVLIINQAFGQLDYFLGENVPRLMLNPTFAFMDHARFKSSTGEVRGANAYGGSFTYMEPWNVDGGNFRGGGYLRATIGFGKNGDRNWIPFEGSLGAVAAMDFGLHEVGVDYGIMGIYGFASYAFWGSSMTFKYRFSRFQVELLRGGAGAIRGWIVPRFETGAFNGFAFNFLATQKYYVGMKYLKMPVNGGTDNKYSELRLNIGLSLDEDIWDL